MQKKGSSHSIKRVICFGTKLQKWKSCGYEFAYYIFDKTRQKMLLPLAAFKNDFYFAGGTGLALQLGHRISEDFDFFTNTKINVEKK